MNENEDTMDDREDFLKTFKGLSDNAQEERAYTIAEGHASKMASPKGIRAVAVGIRLGLLGESLPAPSIPNWRRGYSVGRSIRDGSLPIPGAVPVADGQVED
jgi:hypothetical protein